MIRGQSLREGMSSYLVDQIDALPNVDMLPSADVTAVSGTRGLESITWCNLLTGETGTLAADAMFVFIGAEPHTELVAGLVDRDPAGFIVTGPDLLREGKRPPGWPLERDPFLLETSRPGIFAAGDVRRGAVRRVASAVGEGAIAVTLVHQYLATV
jgi:thioredoxin reductase (NADPH)